MPDDEGRALFRAAQLATAAGPPAPLLEVGTYCGKSAVYLGAAAAEAGTVLYTVDHHHGSEELQPGWAHHDPDLLDPVTGRVDSLPHARAAIAGAALDATVILVVGDSPTIAAQWATPLALVFIDGGHGAESAWADYEGWTTKLAPGGLLAIHDVFPDPADGGRPPYELYCAARSSGRYDDCSELAVGSLRVLRRRPA